MEIQPTDVRNEWDARFAETEIDSQLWCHTCLSGADVTFGPMVVAGE